MANYYPRLAQCLGPLVRGYSRLEVVGREHLPSPGQPVILACNHAGSLWWDALCLAAALPRREVRFVAQHWDSQSRLLVALLSRVGALFQVLDVAQIDEQDAVVQALERGQTICVYPEQSYHTFRRRYTLFRFAPHVVRYAELGQAVIVPTAIIGAEEAAPTLFGWKSRGMPFHFPLHPPLVLPRKITVEFGPPRTFAQLTTEPNGADRPSDACLRGADRLRHILSDMIGRYRHCRTSDRCYLEHRGWW